MAKFIFRIEKYDDGFRKVDEFEEWITANERLDAWAIINKAFPICYLLFNVICLILLIFA